jgi:hypothetical protein
VLKPQDFGPNTVFVDSFSSIIEICAAAKDMTVGIAPSHKLPSTVKSIAVKEDAQSRAWAATADTVRDKSYPLVLPFYFYWDSKTADARIAKFADFCAAQGLGQPGAAK